ncbi:MAG: hypothetical protein ACRELY_11350 [Polyangiaceae bacterium]
MTDAEKIDELEKAFARGDYSVVTKGAPALTKSEDDDVRKRAEKLVRRVTPDAAATVIFIVAALLLVAIAFYFELRPEAKGLK